MNGERQWWMSRILYIAAANYDWRHLWNSKIGLENGWIFIVLKEWEFYVSKFQLSAYKCFNTRKNIRPVKYTWVMRCRRGRLSVWLLPGANNVHYGPPDTTANPVIYRWIKIQNSLPQDWLHDFSSASCTSRQHFWCSSGLSPAYLPDYCKPTTDNTGRSHFTISQHVPAVCSTDTHNLRWYELCRQWTS